MDALFRLFAAIIIAMLQALSGAPLTPAPGATATAPVAATATPIPSATHTIMAVSTPTATLVPSNTATVAPSISTVTRTATPSSSPLPSNTPVPTATNSPTPTTTNSPLPMATVTFTASPRPTSGSAGSGPLAFAVTGVPPAQTLPAALLVYPLIQASATQDTRIEIMNLTGSLVSVQCFYVTGDTCNHVDFFLTLTPQQPVSWKASTGFNGNGRRVAPPLIGEGELKCVVEPSTPDLAAHNALQGRALISDSTGSDTVAQTVGYTAIAFRRLSPGDFTGVVELDGITYEECPDRLHFNALASQAGSDSDLVLVPCSEDLLNGIPASSAIQFAVINELEQSFSGSVGLTCFQRRRFSSIAALRRSTLGTDTAHVIVRAIDVPVIGLVIDRFKVSGSGAPSTSANNPYLEGGRSATITLP